MSAEAVTKKRGRPKKAIESETIVILNSAAAEVVETAAKTRRQTTAVKGKTLEVPAAKRKVTRKVKAEKDDVEIEKPKAVSSKKSAKNVEDATPQGKSMTDVDASSTAVSAGEINLLERDSNSVKTVKLAEESPKPPGITRIVSRGDELRDVTLEIQQTTIQPKQHPAETTQSISRRQIITDQPGANEKSLTDVVNHSTTTPSSLEYINTAPAEPNNTTHGTQRQQQIENLEATFLRGISELQAADSEFKALSSRVTRSVVLQSLQEKVDQLSHDRVELASSVNNLRFQSLQEKADQLAHNRVEIFSVINDLRLSRATDELAELAKQFKTATNSDNIPEFEQTQSVSTPLLSTTTEAQQFPDNITAEFSHSTSLDTSSNRNTGTDIPQTTENMPMSIPPSTTPKSKPTSSTTQTSSFSSSSPQSKEPSKPISRPRPSTFTPLTPPQSRPPPSQPLPSPPKRPTEQTLQELKKNPNFQRLKWSWTGLIVGVPLVIVLGRYLLNDLQKKQAERRQTSSAGGGSIPSTLTDDQSPISNNIGVDSRGHSGVTSNGGV